MLPPLRHLPAPRRLAATRHLGCADAVWLPSCAARSVPEFLPEGVVRVTGVMTELLAAAAKKTTTSSSSGSATFIIFLVLIALVAYFLLIRPQKQKQRRQREQQSNIGVGDAILTVGGIVGKVIAMDAEHVTILSGEDTVGFPAVGNEPTRLVLVRNAIARKIEPRVDLDGSGEDEHDGTEDSGEHSANGHGQLEYGDDHIEYGDDHGFDNGSAEGASTESEGTSP